MKFNLVSVECPGTPKELNRVPLSVYGYPMEFSWASSPFRLESEANRKRACAQATMEFHGVSTEFH